MRARLPADLGSNPSPDTTTALQGTGGSYNHIISSSFAILCNHVRPLFADKEKLMKVLFTSCRPLHRAENIEAVWNAWEGDKIFGQMAGNLVCDELFRSDTDLIVTDEYVAFSPVPVVMIFHGAAGGKSYGLDMERPYVNEDTMKMLDYVVTSTHDPKMIEMTAKQCGVPIEKVVALGMPRTDAYFKEWPRLSDKRTYLFAPTFRADGEPRFPDIDWELLDSLLTDDEALLVKPHMVQEKLVEGTYKHIAHVSSQLPTTPFLMGSDVIITDYSSIAMDAHVAGKPVVLFEKDARYRIFRNMYLPYPNGYAGRYATDEKDLVAILRTAKYQTDEDLDCLDKCCSACDGHSTERVIKLMEDILNGKTDK